MCSRLTLIASTAIAIGLAAPVAAQERARVVWQGSYTAPYDVAGDCLAKHMAGIFDGAALTADSPRHLRVGLWQGTRDARLRDATPDASFVIQPSGDGRVEIGWQRAAHLPEVMRLDEQARSAAIECGGRSA